MSDSTQPIEPRSIRDQIRELGERWHSPEYVDSLSIPQLVRELIISAWLKGTVAGPDADLLREAWHRLNVIGALTGDYP